MKAELGWGRLESQVFAAGNPEFEAYFDNIIARWD